MCHASVPSSWICSMCQLGNCGWNLGISSRKCNLQCSFFPSSKQKHPGLCIFYVNSNNPEMSPGKWLVPREINVFTPKLPVSMLKLTFLILIPALLAILDIYCLNWQIVGHYWSWAMFTQCLLYSHYLGYVWIFPRWIWVRQRRN